MDLEIYSQDPDDLSNMSDSDFTSKYDSIILKSCKLLKDNRFACFVVGDIRNSSGLYKDFITITKNAFYKAGLGLYNDIILLNVIGSASMRINFTFATRKVCKIHQNVLVFYKGDAKKIGDHFENKLKNNGIDHSFL
jgi:hypothetical protein